MYIANNAAYSSSSYSSFYTYSPPSGYSSGSSSFLAGSYSFTPDEIETFFYKTFVPPGEILFRFTYLSILLLFYTWFLRTSKFSRKKYPVDPPPRSPRSVHQESQVVIRRLLYFLDISFNSNLKEIASRKKHWYCNLSIRTPTAGHHQARVLHLVYTGNTLSQNPREALKDQQRE